MLINDLSVVQWNLEKNLPARRRKTAVARIVPSAWYDHFESADIAGFFSQSTTTDMLVIKPTVGANAMDTLCPDKPGAV